MLSAALAVPMAIVSIVPASAASYDDEAQKCINEKHVFVYAERDDGHVDTGCASEFSNGVEALKSAGFDIGSTDFGGDLGLFIDSINGYPETLINFTLTGVISMASRLVRMLRLRGSTRS